MLSDVRRLIGAIHVEEGPEVITISGLPADVISRDITKLWKTSKIGTHMFVKIERSKVVFYRFFALEFQYAIQRIRGESRNIVHRRALATLLDELEANTWLGIKNETLPPRLDFSKLSDFNLQPLPHQRTFLETYDRIVSQMALNGYVLASPPGSGKTLMGLYLGHMLHADAIVVVCPKNAIRKVWLDNILRFIPDHAPVWMSDEDAPVTSKYRYYICHYEQIDRLLEGISAFKNRNVFVDLDECHNFNDPTSARVQKFIQFVKETKSQDVIWASGTPIKALGAEMIPFLRTADPSFTEAVEERFKRIFGMKQGIAGDILSHRLGIVMYQVPKSVVMEGQPIFQEIKVRIPNAERYTLASIRDEMALFIKERIEFYQENYNQFLKTYEDIISFHLDGLKSASQKAEYDRYAKLVKLLRSVTDYRQYSEEIRLTNIYEKSVIIPNLPNPMKEPFRKAKSVVKYYPLVCRGEVLGRILGRRRIECHQDMIAYSGLENIIDASVKKTLIFSSFVEVVDTIAAHLKKFELSPLIVYGDTNKDIEGIVNRFTKDPKINPLLATLQSLSTAIPILAANTVVFTNQPFRSFEKEQAIARIDRLGQDEQTYVIDLLLDTGAAQNISTRSADILEWSRAQVDLLMGGTTTVAIEAYAERAYGSDVELTTSEISTLLGSGGSMNW